MTKNETDNTVDGCLVRLCVVIGALYEAHGLTKDEIRDKVEEILDWEPGEVSYSEKDECPDCGNVHPENESCPTEPEETRDTYEDYGGYSQ